MDRGIFRGSRGTADGKRDLLAMGIEKLHAQGPQGIEQSDRFKCIPVSRMAGMIDTTFLFVIQTVRHSLRRTPKHHSTSSADTLSSSFYV
jgi:hypothetical protein